jgi:hypothetical protein
MVDWKPEIGPSDTQYLYSMGRLVVVVVVVVVVHAIVFWKWMVQMTTWHQWLDLVVVSNVPSLVEWPFPNEERHFLGLDGPSHSQCHQETGPF